MTDVPSSWVSTTHAWASSVDHEHLREIRDRAVELTGGSLSHLVLEVLAYPADEAKALGRRGACTVTFRADGSVAVSDDGRGTDTRRDAAGVVVRKPVMATRDLRFFGVEDGPVLADGRRRRGISVVSALSAWLVHTNRRGDGAWTQRYEWGVPVTDLEPIETPTHTGTTVEFMPDATLIHDLAVTRSDLSSFERLDVTVR